MNSLHTDVVRALIQAREAYRCEHDTACAVASQGGLLEVWHTEYVRSLEARIQDINRILMPLEQPVRVLCHNVGEMPLS